MRLLDECELSTVFMYDETISKKSSKAFWESANSLNYYLEDEFYLEARINNTRDILGKIGNAMDNTLDTTGKILGAYDDVTDGGGKLLKATADLIFAAIRIITRVAKFILTSIAIVPITIAKAITALGELPANIRNKIRGNIKLYVTAEDLEFFHNTLFKDLEAFMSLVKDMGRGDMWGTFWDGDKNDDEIRARNDMQLYAKIEGFFNRIDISFKQTYIELRDPRMREIYFGNKDELKIVDGRGNIIRTTYLKALEELIVKLKTLSPQVKEVQQVFNDKVSRTEVNGKLARLRVANQLKIRKAIQMISRVTVLIGKFIEYVNRDAMTITNSAAKVAERFKDSDKTENKTIK